MQLVNALVSSDQAYAFAGAAAFCSPDAERLYAVEPDYDVFSNPYRKLYEYDTGTGLSLGPISNLNALGLYIRNISTVVRDGSTLYMLWASDTPTAKLYFVSYDLNTSTPTLVKTYHATTWEPRGSVLLGTTIYTYQGNQILAWSFTGDYTVVATLSETMFGLTRTIDDTLLVRTGSGMLYEYSTSGTLLATVRTGWTAQFAYIGPFGYLYSSKGRIEQLDGTVIVAGDSIERWLHFLPYGSHSFVTFNVITGFQQFFYIRQWKLDALTMSPGAGTSATVATQPVDITITSPDSALGVTVQYTNDGSSPDTGTLYSGPVSQAILRHGSVTIKARGYLTGLLPSDILTRTYTWYILPRGAAVYHPVTRALYLLTAKADGKVYFQHAAGPGGTLSSPVLVGAGVDCALTRLGGDLHATLEQADRSRVRMVSQDGGETWL